MPFRRRFVPNPPGTAGTKVPARACPVDSAHRLNRLPKGSLRCQTHARPPGEPPREKMAQNGTGKPFFRLALVPDRGAGKLSKAWSLSGLRPVTTPPPPPRGVPFRAIPCHLFGTVPLLVTLAIAVNLRIKLKAHRDLRRDCGSTRRGGPRVEWSDHRVAIPVGEAPRPQAAPPRDREPAGPRLECGDWLRTFLAEGPQSITEVFRAGAGDAAGFSKDPVRRVKYRLSAVARKPGFDRDAQGSWQSPAHVPSP